MYLNHLLPTFWRVLTLAALAAGMAAQPARADILISPQRVTLDEANRKPIISLHNPGTEARTYRLKWVERRLDEEGKMIAIKEGENPRSIASMVRFSPRRVVVEPGKTQTVRLDYRPPADLAPGEYRSHLLIQLEPREDGGGGTPALSGEKDGMTFRLDALLSFSVPVFVRHGAGTATAQITAVEPTMVERDGAREPGLKVSLTRGGEFSTYGRLVVYQQLNAKAPVEQISEAGGVAMYTEISRLTRVVALKPGTQLQPGSWVRITYEGEGAERGKIFAEREFQIGN